MMGILLSVPACALKPSILPKGGGKLAGEVVNGLSRKLQHTVSCQMRARSFHQKITPLKDIKFSMYKPSKKQMRSAYGTYIYALKATEAFAKNFDTRVYYQCTEEFTPFSQFEIESFYRELLEVRARLNKASLDLEPGDEGFWNALSYLKSAEEYLTAMGTGIIPSLSLVGQSYTPEERTDRTLNYVEFFLGTPFPPIEDPSQPNLFAHQKEWAATLPLPKQLKVAVVMDSMTNIFWLRWMNSHVAELKDWQMDFYKDPEDLLKAPGRLNYDLVLTDMLISNGGGAYLSSQLRRQKFEGTILTATNYQPINESMRKWYRAGLDGMISLSQRMVKAEVDIVEEARKAEVEPEDLGDLEEVFQKIKDGGDPFYKQFLQALRNYYYYRDKHQWKR